MARKSGTWSPVARAIFVCYLSAALPGRGPKRRLFCIVCRDLAAPILKVFVGASGSLSKVASETAGVGALAERYASALFDLALEKRALDGVARDLDALARMLAESPDLPRLVRT